MTHAVPFNDLARGLRADRTVLDRAMAGVVDSGWLVLGPANAQWERDLASYLGPARASLHVLGVASGTDALELALRGAAEAVDGGDRSLVLTAANAGAYTSVATIRAGLQPCYADVDPVTHLLTADTIASALSDDAISSKTLAVVVTHLYGRAADMQPIVELCRARGIFLVEDCAQSLGARSSAGAAGTFGDAATFSFYPTKNLGALGDGGAVVTSHAALHDNIRQLRQYGWGTKYHVTRRGGVNSRLDELQAAVLSARLPLLDDRNARRREVIAAYRDAAQGSVEVLPAEGAGHAAHLAVAVCADRQRFEEHLDEHGIGHDVHYPLPDHLQVGLAGGTAPAPSLPVTERLAQSVISLPLFPELNDSEIERVRDALATFRSE